MGCSQEPILPATGCIQPTILVAGKTELSQPEVIPIQTFWPESQDTDSSSPPACDFLIYERTTPFLELVALAFQKFTPAHADLFSPKARGPTRAPPSHVLNCLLLFFPVPVPTGHKARSAGAASGRTGGMT